LVLPKPGPPEQSVALKVSQDREPWVPKDQAVVEKLKQKIQELSEAESVELKQGGTWILVNSRRYVREALEGLQAWDELRVKVPPKHGSTDKTELEVTWYFGDPLEATTGHQPVDREAGAPGAWGGVFLVVKTEDANVPNADPLWKKLDF